MFGDLERASGTILGAVTLFVGLRLSRRNLLWGALLIAGGGLAIILPLASFQLETPTILLIIVYVVAVVISLATEIGLVKGNR